MTNNTARDEALASIETIAQWSPWASFSEVATKAPKLPGVYLFRNPRTRDVIYVGMAGERSGSGRAQGLWGRLGVYRIGKGANSGFGEAVLDRALADEDFLMDRLAQLRSHGPARSKEWAKAAIAWLDPEVRWTICSDKLAALALENRVEEVLRAHGLWNLKSMKATD